MNRTRFRTVGQAWILSGLMVTAALGPGAAAPVSAQLAAQAISATFNAETLQLTVTGDALDNTISLSRNAAGEILVNGGAVTVAGGTPTVANTALIQVFGLDGHDQVTLDQANGALPNAHLFGGDGDDTLRRCGRRPALRPGGQ